MKGEKRILKFKVDIMRGLGKSLAPFWLTCADFELLSLFLVDSDCRSHHRQATGMLPTPSTSHVDFNRVYEPAEDSFLLLDTLSLPTETAFLQQRFNPRSSKAQKISPLVLEIGTGSGVVTAFVTAHARELLGRTDVLTLGADVNVFACAATVETVEKACNEKSTKLGKNAAASTFLTCAQADLGSAIRPHSVDVLIFNPPYVPSAELPKHLFDESTDRVEDHDWRNSTIDNFEHESHLLSLSYAGGMDGMEVTNRLLDQIPELLDSNRGTAYILLCKQNKPQKVVQRVRGWGASWAVDVVSQSGKTGGWEKLQILRIWRI